VYVQINSVGHVGSGRTDFEYLIEALICHSYAVMGMLVDIPLYISGPVQAVARVCCKFIE
jgi:hypothetical protein